MGYCCWRIIEFILGRVWVWVYIHTIWPLVEQPPPASHWNVELLQNSAVIVTIAYGDSFVFHFKSGNRATVCFSDTFANPRGRQCNRFVTCQLLLTAANQPPPDVQAAVARAAHDPQLVGGLVGGRDQRARRHGRQLLDAGHHHPRPGQLLQAGGPQPGGRPRGQDEQEALLQSQVGGFINLARYSELRARTLMVTARCLPPLDRDLHYC